MKPHDDSAMRHHEIYMGQKEGWTEVGKELGLSAKELWTAVRTGKIKSVETHERVYIIPPDEELRLTGNL
ncbi:hypothetical protein HY994_04570 [Candidatus Micrarchaeota archaeon]|nr:hypothetical protein [Candidatus Micrarchaeota archaeon]